MTRGALIVCGISVALSGCLSPIGLTPVDEDGAVPIFVHELSLAPGCYVAPPAAPESTSAELPVDMMVAAREMQERNLLSTLHFLTQCIDLMLAEPNASDWQIDATTPLGANDSETPFQIEIRAHERARDRSAFTLTTTRRGLVLTPSGEEEHVWVTTADGRADPNTTRVSLPGATYRWSDHVIEARSLVTVPGTATAGEAADASLLRGCDPETGISFEGASSRPLTCWNAGGAFVSCVGVDVWP